MAKVRVNHRITTEMLQTRMHYWSSDDPKALDSDKKCIMCHKRNMNWPRYQQHLENAHNIIVFKDGRDFLEVDNVTYVRKTWLEEETPSPNPRLYDSVNEQEISEFDSASDENSDDEEPPKIMKLPAKLKTYQSPAESSSDSEDPASDSSIRSKSAKPRQQVSKKLKYMSSRIDTLSESVEKFEEKLLGIENNAKNISENISTMNTEHKSSISSLSSSIEKNSKTVSKFMEMQISHEVSSKDLKKELEKSQELSIS